MATSNEKDELISMEEGRSNITVNRRVHEQSHSCQLEIGQASNKNIPCASLRNMLQSLEDAISEDKKEDGKRPKIQKASYMLRLDEKIEKYFEPRMISIGPLHHGDRFEPAGKLKRKLAALFIEKHGLDKIDLYNKINGKIDSLRKCYLDKDIKDINNDDLACMFLVDGCALLHYIDYAWKGKLRELGIKSDMEAFAQQDLFLLENQLPYQVLNVLITSIALVNLSANDHDQVAANDVRESISQFVDKIARNIRSIDEPSDQSITLCKPKSPSQPPPAHLLELLWRRFVGDNEPSQGTKTRRDNRSPSQPPLAYLLKILCRLLVGDDKQSQDTKTRSNNRYPFRNVNELKATWIKFEPADTKGSLRDVSFSSHWFTGTLRLPSLAVDDSTEPMFLNLIALEMCLDFENDFPVSSYISFLDSLIDQPDDVKDLRKVHILHNALGSDEHVARLFNEIGT